MNIPPQAPKVGGCGVGNASEIRAENMVEEPFSIQVPEGPRLEGRLGLVASTVEGLVICHPHPLYGGDMDNPVVARTAEVAREAGLSTLRFNFRGVGGSTGIHDQGEGERDDARAALLALANRLPPGRRLGLAGYSFGAWVSSRVAAPSAPLAGLCLIAPPLGLLDFPALDGYGEEILLVAGTRDPYCGTDDLRRLAEHVKGARMVLVEGADHFFSGKLFPLGEAVRAWVERWAHA